MVTLCESGADPRAAAGIFFDQRSACKQEVMLVELHEILPLNSVCVSKCNFEEIR